MNLEFKSLPEENDLFGYYWVKHKSFGTKLIYLCPGDQFKNDGASVEAWDCPGISRHRLVLAKLPAWNWSKIQNHTTEHDTVT